MADLALLYRRFLCDLWTAEDADLERLAERIVAPGFVVHQARVDDGSQSRTGPAALAALVRQGRAPFDSVSVGIEVGPLVDGPMVAARWAFSGTYRGGVPGATASAGTPVTFGGNDLLRAESDRFVEYWVSSDGLALMVQLGVPLG